MKTGEPLIFELSEPGRLGHNPPEPDVPTGDPAGLLPDWAVRTNLPLPEVCEPDVVRHFTHLSQRQMSVDSNFYPLGSCTMKYNPKVNERVAAMDGLSMLHPLQPEATCQGALKLMHELGHYLMEIGGMDAVSLQPAAGAQGEMAALLMMRAYHDSRGDTARRVVIVPDSAHGTNPASAARAGFDIRNVPSNENGLVDVEALRSALGPDVAAMMLTNPNTLGLFETDAAEICRMVHEVGGLMYCDGANMNATLGISRPGDVGFDAMHFNLHKTFSTPHGGGGPGAGPICVKKELAPYLPTPVIECENGKYLLDYNRPKSIGMLHSFYGNYLVLMRAFAYIRAMGPRGLRQASECAVLNANYLRVALKDVHSIPFGEVCMHEFVMSADKHLPNGIRALDIAKRLLDFGIHPPTVYFPLIVREALMIEPTDTETKRTLDEFIRVMKQIDEECSRTPDVVKEAPTNTPVQRVDEVMAAKKLDLSYIPVEE